MADEINLDLEIIQAIWDQYEFSLKMDEPVLLKAIRDEGQWIHDTQSSFADKSVPPYDDYIDASFMDQVD